MRIARYLVIVAACLMLLAALPHFFLPKRWHEIQPGQHRPSVVAVLGVPDADYFNAKSFDGWFNPFYLGASTITVRYGRNSDVVVAVQLRTHWGLSYRGWARGYAKDLQ